MSEYKPITGELRNWFEHAYIHDVGETPWFGWKNTIEQMLDAIDSIHANLERENESLKAELDRARGEWDFWESTHVELPKDANGEYIHIGDVMDFSKNVRNLTVLGIGMMNESECSWGVFVREGRDYVWYNAKFLRHHAPTVEDVLREFYVLAVRGKEAHAEDVDGDVLAEYAAKLRLAGDAE